jgi:hypothetical protein
VRLSAEVMLKNVVNTAEKPRVYSDLPLVWEADVIADAGGQRPCSPRSAAAMTAVPPPSHGRKQVGQYLRDNAIQQLFAVGLGMSALDEPQVQHRLVEYVGDLDVAISAIYVAVSELMESESDLDGNRPVSRSV